LYYSYFSSMTQVQLLERELLFDDSTSAVDDRQFHTVTPDDIKRLNELFYRHQCAVSRVAVGGAALGVGGAVLTGGSAFAQTGGGGTGGAGGNAADAAAASIAAGVKNAVDMIKAVDGIALAGFGVALAPMGFMLVLRILNMVLSRV
jgi:hypothetical protein